MITMISKQIRALLAPPNFCDSNKNIASHFNASFQTFDDLEGLESLLRGTEQRNDELQFKLSLSTSTIDALLAETCLATEAHIHTALELSLLRHSLTDELSELSKDLVSTLSDDERKPTLLEDIEALHRNLKELQNVKGYLQVVEHALKLSEQSVDQLLGSKLSITASSFNEYRTLQAFVEKVSVACSEVEVDGNQALALVRFLEGIRRKTWDDIQSSLSRSLNSSAEKIGWPVAVDYVSSSADDRAMFEYAFRNLLKLQAWGDNNTSTRPLQRSPIKCGLYPIQALVQPISMRFKYHFEGSRQTNRLDKPEWYFTHVLNVIHDHQLFMESFVQKLLDSSEYRGLKAWDEFTYLLLPLVSRKLKHTIPSLLSRPSLLAHTIYQTLIFDAALTEGGFNIQYTSAAKQRNSDDKWEGVSNVILGNTEWFEAWVLGEQRFTEEQYHETIGAADAWSISADDEHEHDEDPLNRDSRSTNSARRICSLIEQVTDRYSPLNRFGQRMRFLLTVQLPILNHYHGRIASSLDAFEALSSAFIRAVPGALNVGFGGKEEGSVHIDNRELTSGVEGVQRLCKALLSAKYVEATMRSWGEEVFFIELWTEINHSADLRSQAISSVLLPDPKALDEQIPQDTLFDRLITQYENLVDRAIIMVVQQICGEVETLLKAHFSRTSKPDHDEITLSQTLMAPIALLSSHITFLQATMPQVTLTTLYRRITSRLAEYILHRQILYRGHFSLTEGKTIQGECELWVETCRAVLSGGLAGGRIRVEVPWAKLLQAASLASADGEAWAAITDVAFKTQVDEEWQIAMTRLLGPIELTRDDIVKILRRREDCAY